MAQILIVDDDRDVVEILRLVLQMEGHQVSAAPDGKQGLAYLEHHRPDMILLDVEMPVMSGPDMALGLLLHDAGLERIPILLISGAVDLQAVAARIGTPYCLEKPVAVAALLATVDQVLGERLPPQPLLEDCR